MRLQEIVGIIREYFTLAFILVLVLCGVMLLLYFALYKKCLKGKKRLSTKKLLLLMMFSGYIIMVIGVTFLNRDVNYYAGINLSLFSSYREAWYDFSVRHWQYIYLNICMFIPFGLLFPLLHPRFRRAIWTIGIAALCTFSIESIQLLTGYGNFVVDDLFNNVLGAVIGYGFIMGVMAIKEKKIKRLLLHSIPLLVVITLSVITFTYYHLKEFGNLPIVAVNKVNMVNVNLTSDIEFNDQKEMMPIYKAPSYTKAEATDFAEAFFENLNVDPSNIEDISYPDQPIYRSHGEKPYDLWIDPLDGSYQVTDFTAFGNREVEPEDADEESLRRALLKFEITLQEGLQSKKIETGLYEWAVDKEVHGNQLIDGSLTATFYSDQTVKSIVHQLITYDKVKDVQMKSEQEAFDDLAKGKFKIHSADQQIESLTIHEVQVDYYLDSKGYFHPVYAFESTINDSDTTILVPGF